MANRRSTSHPFGGRGPSGRPAIGALAAVALALLLSVGALAAPAGGRPAQDPGLGGATTTTVVAPTATTLAGAGAGVGASTTTTAATPTSGGKAESTRLLTESRKIMAIVGALVLIAILLTVVTVRYWRHTKPFAPTPPVAARHAKPEVGRAARRAEAATAGARATATPAAAAADPPPDRPAAPATATRGSRRAVAGADHAGADDDWEPRTGEHERVVLPPQPTGPSRPSRPSRAGREVALRQPDDTGPG